MLEETKRAYEEPVLEIVEFETEDVITSSWNMGEFPIDEMEEE